MTPDFVARQRLLEVLGKEDPLKALEGPSFFSPLGPSVRKPEPPPWQVKDVDPRVAEVLADARKLLEATREGQDHSPGQDFEGGAAPARGKRRVWSPEERQAALRGELVVPAATLSRWKREEREERGEQESRDSIGHPGLDGERDELHTRIDALEAILLSQARRIEELERLVAAVSLLPTKLEAVINGSDDLAAPLGAELDTWLRGEEVSMEARKAVGGTVEMEAPIPPVDPEQCMGSFIS